MPTETERTTPPSQRVGPLQVRVNSARHNLNRPIPSAFPQLEKVADMKICYIFTVFTAQRSAKHGICHYRVSVCLSVHHIPVLYQNG